MVFVLRSLFRHPIHSLLHRTLMSLQASRTLPLAFLPLLQYAEKLTRDPQSVSVTDRASGRSVGRDSPPTTI
jgi:hypothetical protein